jgi:hypothetical protein
VVAVALKVFLPTVLLLTQVGAGAIAAASVLLKVIPLTVLLLTVLASPTRSR